MADKIVADYIVKTDEAVKNLNRLEKEVKDLSTKGKKSASDIESNFKKTSEGLVSQFKKVGAALGVAFGTAQLVEFGKESIQVAAKAEGISRAFEKLNSPTLLSQLRKATRGTVSDLELMQRAVQANNFQLPLDKLATLFKFATDRAIETGESVDYLTESIVLGISRKSIPIMDNLGISSIALQDEMKKTGDFAQAAFNIVERSMADAGDVADTTSVKFAQMQTSWENFKLEFGTVLISTGVIDSIQKVVDAYVIALRVAKGETLETITIQEGAEEAIASFADNAKRSLEKLIKPLEDGKENTEALTKANETLADSERKLNALINKKTSDERELLMLQKQLEETNPFNKLQRIALEKSIDNTKAKIALDDIQVKQIKALISVYDNYTKGIQGGNDVESEAIKNLKFYNDLIEELQTKQKDANTTREEVRQLEEDINEAIRQRLILLGRLREVGGDSMQGIRTIAPSLLPVASPSTPENIDPSLGNPSYAPDGANSATGQGLFTSGDEPPVGDEELAAWMAYANIVMSINDSITNAIIAGHDRQLQSLNEQLESGQITREQYDKKRRSLERKKAADEKSAAIFSAVINTATAVVSALNTQPFLPLGPIMAALAGGLGAVQIGTIAAQPLPQFAEGGWVDSKGKIHGRSHAQGGVKLEAEGDEFIVKGKVAKTNASLLEALNAGNGQEWINKNMVYPAIQNVIDSGVDGGSDKINNLNIQFKDHNLIHSDDMTRSTIRNGFKFLAKELKTNNQKRGGYHA